MRAISVLFLCLSTGIIQSQTILCPDNLAFENGSFSNWTCYTGSTTCTGSVNTTTMSVSGPVVNRHTIISRTPVSAIDPYGLFPVNPPDGSNFCVKLGNTQTGSEAERISYTLSIPAGVTNYSVNFRYAVVFEDPSHNYCEQPRFTARLFDPVTSTYLPCGSFEFVSSAGLPGFAVSSINPDVKYRPWASAFINLAAYSGRTLRLEFTTVDCTKSGHWGYAYIDVDNNCDLAAQLTYACTADMAVLTAPPGFQGYNWWNNNYTSLIGNTQTVTLIPAPPIGANYWVEVIPYNGVGCRDTLPVRVSPANPVANFSSVPAQCQTNNLYAFNSSSTIPAGNILNYNWDFGDGNTGSGDSVTHSYNSPGTYTVKLLVEGSLGCRDSISRSVTVNPMPVAMFNQPPAQCLTANNFDLAAIIPPNSPPQTAFNWSFGDGQFASGSTVTHSYTTDGNYNIKLRVTSNNGCQDSLTRMLTIHPSPVALLLTPSGTEFCENGSVQISASGGQSYEWYRDGQLIPNVTGNILNVNKTGNYSVKAVSSFGCTGSATIPVQLSTLTKPLVDFDFPLQCEGSALVFTDRSSPTNSGSLSWQWSFGDNTSSFAQHPSHTYTWGGNYKVTLTVTPSRCPDLTATITKKVPVEKARQGIRYATINAIENMSTHFFARKFGSSYLWGPSIDLTDTKIYNPVFLGTREREYTVRITTPLGCTTVDTQLVRIFKQIDIVAPKAFTPNGDGHNDKLNFFLLGIDQLNFFRVFNRWGQLMFETSDPYQFWDGKYKGENQPLETYVWMAQGRGRDGQTIVRRGQTILIR